MKEKILILSIAGAGKTYLAEHYKNVVDFESLYHLWDYDEDIKHLSIDQHKGNPKRTPNPDYPWNYIEDVKHELEKGRIVVTPGMPNNFYALCVVGDGKLGENVRTILALPHENDFEALAQRFRNRGNPESFIELVRENFYKAHELYKNYKNGEYLIIPPGQYLSDALIAHGINLEPGVGIIKENREGGRHLKDKYTTEKAKKQKYLIDVPSSTITEVQ